MNGILKTRTNRTPRYRSTPRAQPVKNRRTDGCSAGKRKVALIIQALGQDFAEEYNLAQKHCCES